MIYSRNEKTVLWEIVAITFYLFWKPKLKYGNIIHIFPTSSSKKPSESLMLTIFFFSSEVDRLGLLLWQL